MPSLFVRQHPEHYTGERLFPYHEPDCGALAGDIIPLAATEVVFGRDPGGIRWNCPDAAVVYLPYLAINRIHARLRCHGHEYLLEDVRSRTGTYVNGAPIETAPLR